MTNGFTITGALKSGTPKEIASAFSNAVNCFTFDNKKAVQEIKDHGLEKQMAAFTAWLIGSYSQDLKDGNYDDRNEYSCRVCVSLDNLGIQPVLKDYYNWDEETDITMQQAAECMRREHRTLKQSVAGLCFVFLKGVQNDSVELKELLEQLTEQNQFWNCCPFI